MEAKKAEYYDPYHQDHPSYWSHIKYVLDECTPVFRLPHSLHACRPKISAWDILLNLYMKLFRSYMETKCKNHFKWNEWEYHRQVLQSIVIEHSHVLCMII